MSNELIIVKQLPMIEEHLKERSEEIEEKDKNAKSLVCAEENVKTIIDALKQKKIAASAIEV